MTTEASKERRKRYLERLKLIDPERYKRYKSKVKKYKKLKPPYVPIQYDPLVVAANKAKRRLKVGRNKSKRIREYLEFIKSHFKCTQCSESYTKCLEFHHLDPSSKIDDISKTLHNGSIKKLTEEIFKCTILCSNCHKKVHGNVLTINDLPIDPILLNNLKDEFLKTYHPTYFEYLKIQNDLKPIKIELPVISNL